MIKACSILLLLFSSVNVAFGQDQKLEILLMSGKVLSGTMTSHDSIFMYFDEVRKSGKIKKGKLDLERVYSVTDSVGNKRIFYTMDSAFGNYFSQEEMRYYIYGEQDAMSTYKANWVVFSAVPIAGGGGLLLSSSFFVFAVPFLYVVGASIPKVTIKAKDIEHPEMLSEPAYVLGYERTARSRRLFKALISGVASTAIGFTLGQAIQR